MTPFPRTHPSAAHAPAAVPAVPVRLIVLCLLAGLVLALGVALGVMTTPASYTASAVLQVASEGTRTQAATLAQAEQAAPVYLRLAERADITSAGAPGAISIQFSENLPLLFVYATDGTPAAATDEANAVASAFVRSPYAQAIPGYPVRLLSSATLPPTQTMADHLKRALLMSVPAFLLGMLVMFLLASQRQEIARLWRRAMGRAMGERVTRVLPVVQRERIGA